MDKIIQTWQITVHVSNSAQIISAKLKLLRRVLKNWAKNLSNLAKLIANCNLVIAFFDKLEEYRELYLQELNFRAILKKHIALLLEM